jgi:hypothetical protein
MKRSFFAALLSWHSSEFKSQKVVEENFMKRSFFAALLSWHSSEFKSQKVVEENFMKRSFFAALLSFCALLFFASPASAQHYVSHRRTPFASSVTWNVVQHPSNYTCTATGSGNHSCTVTASATTAGNLLILASSVYNNTAVSPTFVSASGDGTWTHCPICAGASNSGSSDTTDAAYILSATGGATSFTFTWAFTSGTSDDIDVELYEVHRSTGTAIYDTSNANGNTACSSCSGPSVTLTGTDFVAVWGAFNDTITMPGSPYTNPSDSENANVGGGFAGALNQTSYSTPVFGMASSTRAAISVLAFK